MPCKVVLFFNGVEDGWTETYYSQVNDPFTLINSFPNSFYTARASGLDKDSTFVAIRATNVAPPRLNYTLYLGNKYSGTGTVLSPSQYPAVENTDALVQFIDILGNRKKTYIRGLPTSWPQLDAQGNPNPPAPMLTFLTAWTNQLTKNALQLRNAQRPPAGAPALKWYNVVNIQELSGSQSLSVLALDSDYTPVFDSVTPIVFQGIPRNNAPGFPKQCVPTSASNTTGPTVNVPWRFRAQGTEIFPQKMRFCQLRYVYNQIADYQFERFTTHKTGRPFFVPRGRAPVAIKRN